MLFLAYIFLVKFNTLSYPIEITEVDPISEYIEIKNISEKEVNLTNFTWSEETSSGKEIFYNFNNYSLFPNKYFVVNTKNKINNSGDKISLYKEKDDLLDSVEIPKSIKDKTYQKINGVWGWEHESKGLLNEAVEEKEEVIEEENVKIEISENNFVDNEEINKIFLSEMLPNPEGVDGDDNEFFEIYNESLKEMNLENLYIKDGSGKKFIFSANDILLPNSYKTFYKKDTNITLNNSNESLYLYSKDDNLISELSFSGSAKSGYSYNKISNGYFWTNKITPNEKNIKIVEDINNEVKYKKNFELFPLKGESKIKNIDIKIDKIIPHSKIDSIDLICKNCENINLKNFQLRSHGEVYKIPKDVFVNTEDILHFEFGNKNKKFIEKSSTGWNFFPQLKKLSSTDNVISFADSSGNILDGICYANQNNYFSSIYKKELGQLKIYKNWNSDMYEYNCLDSSSFTTDSFFKRKNKEDTNTKNDFFRSRKNTDFQKYENLYFDKFLISKNFLEISLINKSSKTINLKNWYLSNNLKLLIDLDNNKDNFLYPNQSFIVKYNTNKYKKYSFNNLFLELRDPSGKVHDVFCLNKSDDEKFIKNNLLVINHWYRNKLWKNEKKQNICFMYHNYNSSNLYERIEFDNVSSVKNYNLSYLKDFSLVNNEKTLDKNLEKSLEMDIENKKIKEENPFILDYKIENDNLMLFGSSRNKTGFIKFFIPSKNLTFNTKIKNNKFIYNLNKPFKKGRYRFYYSFFDKDKKLVYKDEKIVNLETCVLCNELKNISFAKIIPNPKGKDKNNETLILVNNSKYSGWIRDWKLEILNTKTGKIKTIVLPNLFFEKNENINLISDVFKSLPNKNTSLIIKNNLDKVVATSSWVKARQDEEFGLLAKDFVVNLKAKVKKIKSKNSKNIVLEKQNVSTSNLKDEILSIKQNRYVKSKIIFKDIDFVLLKNGYSFIKYYYPSYLPYSEKYFAVDKELSITIKNNQIKNIAPIGVIENKFKN